MNHGEAMSALAARMDEGDARYALTVAFFHAPEWIPALGGLRVRAAEGSGEGITGSLYEVGEACDEADREITADEQARAAQDPGWLRHVDQMWRDAEAARSRGGLGADDDDPYAYGTGVRRSG